MNERDNDNSNYIVYSTANKSNKWNLEESTELKKYILIMTHSITY